MLRTICLGGVAPSLRMWISSRLSPSGLRRTRALTTPVSVSRRRSISSGSSADIFTDEDKIVEYREGRSSHARARPSTSCLVSEQRDLARGLSPGHLLVGSITCQEDPMTYVIVQPCIGVKDASCVEVCPVDCIYEGEDMYYIHPDECIECAACEPECPVDAIFAEEDVPPEWRNFTQINADFFANK